MQVSIGRLRKIIAESLLLEMKCAKCGDDNVYAEQNQPDGSYVCRDCRNRFGLSTSTPTKAPSHAPKKSAPELDIPAREVRSRFPEAYHDWARDSSDPLGDVYSLDNGFLWVEPSFGQSPWYWYEKGQKWVQTESDEDEELIDKGEAPATPLNGY
jgi:DNA-directed RNA polymerase subunit RPC12/RpoP